MPSCFNHGWHEDQLVVAYSQATGKKLAWTYCFGSYGPVYLLFGSIFCCFIQVLCSKEVVHMPDLAHFNTLLDLLVPSRFNRGRHKEFLSMSHSQVTAEQFGKDMCSLEVLAQFPSFGVRFLVLY